MGVFPGYLYYNLPSVARFGENVKAKVISKIGEPTTINVIILSVGKEAF